MNNAASTTRYPIKHSIYSSHQQILRTLGPGGGRNLLDVGCANGELSAALASLGWNVVCIEPDEDDARNARSLGLKVFTLPLQEALLQLPITFDVVVMADVVEHLLDPATCLKALRPHLKPDGLIIASVPNIAHLSIRAQLLIGNFDYTNRGILDKTHLHFFTRKSLLKLINGSGYEISAISQTAAPIELIEPIFGRWRFPRLAHHLNQLAAKVWPTGLAYQFIVQARPND